jgi:hypothetical protein
VQKKGWPILHFGQQVMRGFIAIGGNGDSVCAMWREMFAPKSGAGGRIGAAIGKSNLYFDSRISKSTGSVVSSASAFWRVAIAAISSLYARRSDGVGFLKMTAQCVAQYDLPSTVSAPQNIVSAPAGSPWTNRHSPWRTVINVRIGLIVHAAMSALYDGHL